MQIASAFYDSSLRQGPLGGAFKTDSPPELKGADLLVLWGGEDISPSLYKQTSVKAHASDIPSRRDQIEVNLTLAAVQMGIPILGICRGAQLLCAVGGGALYQHVEHHHSHHPIMYKGNAITSNSCHHQMMIPTDDMEVLAYTPCRSPRKWLDQEEPIEVNEPEPEIVYMPKLRAIGVQGHPEWMSYDSDFVRLVRQLCEEKLNVKI